MLKAISAPVSRSVQRDAGRVAFNPPDQTARQNVQSIAELETAHRRLRTLGDLVADRFAATVGSWTFIIVQSVLLGMWVSMNAWAIWRQWDPYPFVLLNLVLSFQAAFASPIIMMSQNRQARLFERRSQLDLQINLLAEQESTETLKLLRMLCEKLEVLLPADPAAESLLAQTKPDQILQEIEESEKQMPQ